MTENLLLNGISPQDCRLIPAAVAGKDGKVGFQIGNPASHYGQGIGGSTEIDAVSLPSLLLPLERIDLIDIDVQGAEFDILAAAPKPLAQKVKRVHVETHDDQVHANIVKFFRALGWKPHFLFHGNSADKTPWGQRDFQDGSQSWLNPRLCSGSELLHARLYQNSLPWRAMKVGRRVVDRVAPPGTFRRRMFNATLSGMGSRYRRDPADVARRST
jgi:hypothetical protein